MTTLLLAALLSAPAQAQLPAALVPTTAPALAGGPMLTPPRAGVADDGLRRSRNMLMEINLRGRYLSVPNSILDIWFYDNDDEGALDFKRPSIRAHAVGIEYVLKLRPVNWIMYYEYVGTMLDEGYWDDVEEPANHHDGDWVRPDGLGIHVVGASYGHEVAVTDEGQDVWLSMLFGGGLGFGVVTGELQDWHPGSTLEGDDICDPSGHAYERYKSCPADGTKRLPSVLPMVDITWSTRINFSDRATLRFDAGLHDVISLGVAMGAVF